MSDFVYKNQWYQSIGKAFLRSLDDIPVRVNHLHKCEKAQDFFVLGLNCAFPNLDQYENYYDTILDIEIPKLHIDFNKKSSSCITQIPKILHTFYITHNNELNDLVNFDLNFRKLQDQSKNDISKCYIWIDEGILTSVLDSINSMNIKIEVCEFRKVTDMNTKNIKFYNLFAKTEEDHLFNKAINLMNNGNREEAKDIFKLKVLEQYGGIIIDYKIGFVMNYIKQLTQSCTGYFQYHLNEDKGMVLSNSIMGSTPSHTIIKEVYNLIANNYYLMEGNNCNLDIEMSAGKSIWCYKFIPFHLVIYSNQQEHILSNIELLEETDLSTIVTPEENNILDNYHSDDILNYY